MAYWAVTSIWKTLSLVLILNSVFNDANKTALTASSIYVFRICLHREQRAQIVVTRVKPRTVIASDSWRYGDAPHRGPRLRVCVCGQHAVSPGTGVVLRVTQVSTNGGFCTLSSVYILKFVLNIFIYLYVIPGFPNFLHFCPKSSAK